MHKSRIKQALAKFSEISFRDIPDKRGDSASFLSFFLRDEERARDVTRKMAKAGVDGCFYWYDNGWHYLRNWEHLKQLTSAARLPLALIDNHPDYGKVTLPQSDHIMSRTISMQIKLGWTAEQLQQRIAAINRAMRDKE